MGQSARKLLKKGSDYMNKGAGDGCSSDCDSSRQLKVSPFILTRTSSLYFDEDGDLAHEFYQETCSKNSAKKYYLQKIKRGLTQQGEVKLKLPRLHRDFPLVLFEG